MCSLGKKRKIWLTGSFQVRITFACIHTISMYIIPLACIEIKLEKAITKSDNRFMSYFIEIFDFESFPLLIGVMFSLRCEKGLKIGGKK